MLFDMNLDDKSTHMLFMLLVAYEEVYRWYLHGYLTRCILETHKRVLFTNSEDPDEMQHVAAFHQGLHCL